MAKHIQVIAVLVTLPIVTIVLAAAFRSTSIALSSIFSWMSVALVAAPAVSGVIVLVVPRLQYAAVKAAVRVLRR